MRTLPLSSAPRVVRASILPSRMVTVYGGQASTLGVNVACSRTIKFLPEQTVTPLFENWHCGNNQD